MGTAFSGMEFPRFAVEELGYKVNKILCCDDNPSCRKLIKFMFPDIGVHYEDITTRDNNTTPRVDLYAAVLCASH